MALLLQQCQAAWRLLVERARSGEPPFTYQQFSERLGLTHHKHAALFLRRIEQCCTDNKLPLLSALVVRKDTLLPGEGYGGPLASREEHTKTIHEVRAHDWDDRIPS